MEAQKGVAPAATTFVLCVTPHRASRRGGSARAPPIVQPYATVCPNRFRHDDPLLLTEFARFVMRESESAARIAKAVGIKRH